jgi:nucleoside-diphosphate-sugar epimerase
MNILITGATGFIGSHLTKELCGQGYHCRCLVRNIEKAKEIFKDYEDIEFIVGDVAKIETLKNVANNIDVVFHLAAHGHVAAASEEAFKKFYEINVNGTKNLLDECLDKNISKFFHFSSTAAVGLIPDVIVDENTKPQPKTPYQKSKLESEKVVKAFIKANGIHAVIYRPCMVYGVGGFGEFYKFVKLVKKGIMPKIGFKKKLTPLVNVEDVVQACIKGIKGAKIGETYFICGDKSYPFDEIIRYIKKSLSSKKISVYVPTYIALLGASILEYFAKISHKIPIVTRQNIKSTIADRMFSIEKAKKDFNYSPVSDLKQRIKQVIKYYNNNSQI